MRQPPPWVTHEERRWFTVPLVVRRDVKETGACWCSESAHYFFVLLPPSSIAVAETQKLYSSSSQPQLKHERRRDDTYFGLRFKLHFSRSVRLKSRYWFFSLLTTYFCWLYFWVLVKFVCPSVCKHSFERILIKRWGHVNNALKFGSHPLRSSRSARWFICGKLTKAL